MARQKRMKSETGIYHVMLRGINKQQVFKNEDDYKMFLRALAKCKKISGFRLHAYCLMDNHIHLLIQEDKEPIALVFKRLGDMFVYWYNEKYKRTGAVFQGRYRSIPVNDDEYFITVLKYIHNNPVKAGIVSNCADYEFSSYNSYFIQFGLVDTEFTYSLMSVDEFKRIHSESDDFSKITIEDTSKTRLSDTEAMDIIISQTHLKKTDEFKSLPKEMQKAYVRMLKNEGLSMRQICRLTGISDRMVRSAK